MKNKITFIVCTILLHVSLNVYAQTGSTHSSIPPIQLLRAEESYTFLQGNDTTKLFLKKLKEIPISPKNNVYLSLGGQFRPRFKYYSNADYGPKSLQYYTQRLALHANLTLGKYLRVFGELYHGLTTSGNIATQSDEIDWHQGFIELKLPLQEKSNLSLRFGRQEISFGAGRLIGLREGPNIRQSFDLIKLNASFERFSILAFYGSSVNINFGAFDNSFDLLNGKRANPIVWNLGSTILLSSNGEHTLGAYYLGFQSDKSKFNDVVGKELRHSLGIRSFGNVGARWKYNTEVVYQFGDLAGSSISAFNIETDWKYDLKTKLQTLLGLKLDISSGDRERGDGKIETFNPLFVSPDIYSLAGMNTPANLMSLHPSVTFIIKKLTVFLEYALFYRTSINDGLYSPPRSLAREANQIRDRGIARTVGLGLTYQLNRNILFELKAYYFIAGDFIKASGNSENILYFAPTINLRF